MSGFFFGKKRETPKSNPWYEMYKLLLNSLYGKLIQLVDDVDTGLGVSQRVAGGLFNPFWAGQITGHCRATIHRLEHRYAAFHTSTDSILTRASNIPTGAELGDLEIKAHGRLLVIRRRLYFIVNDQGKVEKKALHGFMGRTPEALLALVLQGEGPYRVTRMVRPRQALRSGQKPFRMAEREYRLRVSDSIFKSVAQEWEAHQARQFIPFPRSE